MSSDMVNEISRDMTAFLESIIILIIMISL